jgi:hypothetical protein
MQIATNPNMHGMKSFKNGLLSRLRGILRQKEFKGSSLLRQLSTGQQQYR